MSARSGYVFPAPGSAPEPDRALYPDREGLAERDGVHLFWEVYGEGNSPTILMLPGWHLPARLWKYQIPYLGRHFRVIAFDLRGTGRSSRPRGTDSYMTAELVEDCLAVLDATGTERVICIGKSRGVQVAFTLAAEYPQRVAGIVAIGPELPLTSYPARDVLLWGTFEEPRRWRRVLRVLAATPRVLAGLLRSPTARLLARREGPLGMLRAASACNRRQMLEDFEAFLGWWLTRVVIPDRHSTRQIECLAEWYRQSGPQSVADAALATRIRDPASARELVSRVDAPALVISGDEDLATPHEWAVELARMTGGRLMTIRGCGHATAARYPAIVNIALRSFIESVAGRPERVHGVRAEPDGALQPTGGGAG